MAHTPRPPTALQPRAKAQVSVHDSVHGARQPRLSLSAGDISRIVEMAWEDRTPFEDVAREYGLAEGDVIALMRSTMKPSSFRMWRKRMAGRATKHRALNDARRAPRDAGPLGGAATDQAC